MPVKYDPINNKGNEPRYSPYAAIAAPIAPAIAPTKNPARRPKDCMNGESQGAVVMEPKMISEIGSVAKQMFEASCFPASPPTTKIIGIWSAQNSLGTDEDDYIALCSRIICGKGGISHAQPLRRCARIGK